MVSVAAFYRFARLPDPAALRAPLADLAHAAGVRGSVLLAPEGVNGTIAGPAAGVDVVLSHLRGLPELSGLTAKRSLAAHMPFGRLKVRLKREIVTMGEPVDPVSEAGTYVAPSAWDALISDPETVVIDTRNAYEIAIGSFRGALDPGTDSFGQFPAWWRDRAAEFAGRPVAMFCTGGIRCEKATAFLRGQGVGQVYHLDGGILRYLEETPAESSLWQGECFVFDDRVAVGHGLAPGASVLCRACRKPVTPADTRRPEWEDGVSCHLCRDSFTDADRTRFRERQRQMELARHAGRRHLGPA